MKITELLNAQPTAAAPPRKLDMASLDLFAAHQRQKTLGDAMAPGGPLPMLQRQLPVADLVAPPRDEAMTPQKPARATSPIEQPRDEHPLITKRRMAAKHKDKEPARMAVDPLAALAEAAADAVKEEDEREQRSAKTTATPAKRKPRGSAKAAVAAVAGEAEISVIGTSGGGRSGPMTDEEKRAKQRMLVKKSYYRKINTLNTLRETVTQLEQEYSAVVQASQQNQPKTTLPRHSISALVNASAEGELLRSFQDMAVNIDRLRHENEGLRALAMEQSKSRTRVGILIHEELQDQHKRAIQYGELIQQFPANLRNEDEEAEAQRALASPQTSPAQSPPRATGGNPVIHMTPMTEDECIEVASDAYEELMQFRRSRDFITSGGHVFGWRDRRRIEGDHVQFALEKTFQYRTAEELATSMWRVLSTESGMNRIYSSSLRATYHLVQRVSDHNLVFYRTMERQNVLLKSLIVASFVQTDSGYMVVFRSIDPHKRNVRAATPSAAVQPPLFALGGGGGSGSSLLQPSDRKEIWVDMFSWGVIEPSGPNHEHCTDYFGGFVPATIAANGAFWMMEVLLIALRCESECVGPLFILQQPDDETKSHEETKRTAAGAWRDVRRTNSSDDDHDVVMEMP